MRVDCDLHTSCGANFDFTSTIDHVFIGSALRATSCIVERPPSSPYEIRISNNDDDVSPANIVGASDHSWILVELVPNLITSTTTSTSIISATSPPAAVIPVYRFSEAVSPMSRTNGFSANASSSSGFRNASRGGFRGGFRGFRRPYRSNGNEHQ